MVQNPSKMYIIGAYSPILIGYVCI